MSAATHAEGLAASTRTVRAAIASDGEYGAVVPPIHLSANFAFSAPGECGPYDYTRSGNPTRDHLARAISDLEGGAGCSVTPTGMAAVHVVTQLLRPGDVLVAPHDCYGGCHRLFTAQADRGRFDVVFLDQRSPEAFERVAGLRPVLIWLETPSNPLLRVTELGAWAAFARSIGALTVADNTFLSPANQRPLDHGIDMVVHSTTKFINGHSDVVGGAVVAVDSALAEDLAWWANCIGAAGAPFDAYLTLRGLRTLHARCRVHEENALEVVGTLAGHPAVSEVHHPSLAGHPGHDVARRQQAGWGSLVSFELAGGRPAAEAFLRGLRCFTLAESLGGVESLVAHPATMTHASMSERARTVAGIGEGLLRLSVGIEDPRDLVRDVRAGLARAGEVREPKKEVGACARD